MTNFWQALEQVDWSSPKAIEYRVYHDDLGNIIEYSNEIKDGLFILVPREIWAVGDRSLKIKNGKLVSSKPNFVKYSQSQDGIACDPYDICVIVDDQQDHVKWKLTTYEQQD